ncbi:type II toxin-antitoxin system HicB family antitoxin [Candidatus Saccharibacteria bacterium]|nr:type II toxin-antitoxin system HicB family antitoxin [Candidatus Saccharibacteria bacterium]
MNNIMKYKGYIGTVEFSEQDGLFYGKVQGIRSLISYEGATAAELVADFHDAIDDYLALCESENIAPEIAYKGCLNVRFKDRDIHRQAAIYAITHERSLNSFIEEAVKEKLAAVYR